MRGGWRDEPIAAMKTDHTRKNGGRTPSSACTKNGGWGHPPSLAKPAQTVRLGWHHLCLEIPECWEVLGYGMRSRDGRLLLSDPGGETLQVHWKRLRRPPNLENRIAEWHRSQGDSTAISTGTGHADGWLISAGSSHPLLAVRYDAESKALLTLVFSDHARQGIGDEAIGKVLRSFSTNSGKQRVWAAFGLDVTLPAEWKLESVEAWPAAQRLHFERRRNERVSVHRYGMLPVVVGNDTDATFFARIKGSRILARVERELETRGPRQGTLISYEPAGRGLMELLRKPSRGLAWLWREQSVPRLFIFDQLLRGQGTDDEPVGEVRCQ